VQPLREDTRSRSSPDRPSGTTMWLLCHEGGRYLALRAADVRETMRPMPIEPVPNMPAFVSGLAVVRGAAVPVVDAGVVFGGKGGVARRWVTLALGERSVVLAVESVETLCALEEAGFVAVPPLLRSVGEDIVAAVGTLDARLLLVLEAGRLLTDEQWRALTIAAPAS
jgi:purine-binding chemotaxis protein CheW